MNGMSLSAFLVSLGADFGFDALPPSRNPFLKPNIPVLLFDDCVVFVDFDDCVDDDVVGVDCVLDDDDDDVEPDEDVVDDFFGVFCKIRDIHD